MMSKTIAVTKRTKTIGDRRTLTVTADLHQFGEQAPYFSATAEERNLRRRGDNQVEACVVDPIDAVSDVLNLLSVG